MSKDMPEEMKAKIRTFMHGARCKLEFLKSVCDGKAYSENICNHDKWAIEHWPVLEDPDELIAEIERLRAVVKAAVAWRHAEINQAAERLGIRGGNPEELETRAEDQRTDLRVATDIYVKERRQRKKVNKRVGRKELRNNNEYDND